jgi:8-oxo-dGTP diphosphatase
LAESGAILLEPIGETMVADIKLFVATKAFISFEGRMLILRESSKYQDGTNANKYDVVGGRVEPGQKFDESLLREIREETNLTVSIEKPFFVSEWRPSVRGEQWQIVGIFFMCSAQSREVTLSSDHDDFKWIDPREYVAFDLIENLKPAFEAYLSQGTI